MNTDATECPEGADSPAAGFPSVPDALAPVRCQAWRRRCLLVIEGTEPQTHALVGGSGIAAEGSIESLMEFLVSLTEQPKPQPLP